MGYTEMSWLPHMLTDQGMDPTVADFGLVLWGLVGGVIMPWGVEHFHLVKITPIVLSAVTFAGWLGVFFDADAAPLVWSFLFAVGGLCFPLALALLTARTRTSTVTARLSGLVQPGGYLVPGLIPLVVGWIFGFTGGWGTSLIFLMVWSVGLLVFGVRTVRPVHIEDELLAS